MVYLRVYSNLEIHDESNVDYIICRKAEENAECELTRKKLSSKSSQLTFTSLHIPSALPFPHSISDIGAPCRVPSFIPGWVCCLMRGLNSDPLLHHSPGPVIPIISAHAFFLLYCSKWSEKQALQIGVTYFQKCLVIINCWVKYCWVFIAWRKKSLNFISFRPHHNTTELVEFLI